MCLKRALKSQKSIADRSNLSSWMITWMRFIYMRQWIVSLDRGHCFGPLPQLNQLPSSCGIHHTDIINALQISPLKSILKWIPNMFKRLLKSSIEMNIDSYFEACSAAYSDHLMWMKPNELRRKYYLFTFCHICHFSLIKVNDKLPLHSYGLGALQPV